MLTADLVQCLCRELNDVVVVDADDRLRGVAADRLGVATGHVHRDRPQLPGALSNHILGFGFGFGGRFDLDLGGFGVAPAVSITARVAVKLGEERIGRGLPLALSAPHHAATAVIADQRQVAMALAPRDLVDRDLKQIAEAVLAEQFVADALDDPPDRLPVDPRQPAGRRLVGLRRQPRDEILEVAGKARAVTSERDALDVHAMLRTAQPPQPDVNLQAPTAEIQMPPDRVVMLLVLTMARGVRALRAMKATTTQRDPHANPIGLKADRTDPHTGQIEQTTECARDAHGRRPPVRSFRTANLRSEPVRVAPGLPATPQAAQNPRSAPGTRARRPARVTYDHPRSPCFLSQLRARRMTPLASSLGYSLRRNDEVTTGRPMVVSVKSGAGDVVGRSPVR